MSNQSAFGRRPQAQPSLPQGDVLGTYETYPEAQAVVDRLSKAEFEVKQLAIVGNDLKTVERVTGKLTYGRAAATGAASGAWFGLFFGVLLFLFSTTPQIGFVAAAALIGAGFGMLFGIVSYSMGRRRRDFTSTHQVLASSYQIIIDPQLTAKAQQLLDRPENSSV
ncbi:general stress protein [Conyzicola nivalis]|uniref:general stress protein n=1 Tax=Conyzicola nivalis TaxID=1477021 RepID=UPI001E3E26AF|nr:general stress protein [Conyzicola nivalis]